MAELFQKYRSVIMYVIFGVCTTIVNIVTYNLMYEVWHFSNVLSNVVAWVFAVIFAYITNKLWVFESRSLEKSLVVNEMLKFFSCRLGTGIMDIGIMYLAVDILKMNSMLWKIISNIIVIVVNYIMSKLVIFKKKL